MFRSSRNHLVSGGICIDAFGASDRLAEVRYQVFALLFDLAHLSWAGVSIRN